MSQGFVSKLLTFLSNPPSTRLDLTDVKLDGTTVKKIDQNTRDNEIRSKREEIDLYFKELAKLKKKRLSLGRDEKTARNSMKQDIVQGYRDLQTEIDILQGLVHGDEKQEEFITELMQRLEVLGSEDENTRWDKSMVYNSKKDACELSSLNETKKIE